MNVERKKIEEEITLTLSLTGLCRISLQSYIPGIETYISKTEMWTWRIDKGYSGSYVQLELEGPIGEARKGAAERLGPDPKSLFMFSKRIWI